MSDVSSGSILVADHQGVYVIKMVGDVRLTLCVSFDQCIEELTSREGFFAVLFDLSEAEGLDSTTLGLIAKMAVKCQSLKKKAPLAICTDAGIERLLTTMGLDDICEIIDQPPENFCQVTDFVELENLGANQDEEQIKAKILESHCVLMELNQQNRDTFKDLVQTLKCG